MVLPGVSRFAGSASVKNAPRLGFFKSDPEVYCLDLKCLRDIWLRTLGIPHKEIVFLLTRLFWGCDYKLYGSQS